MRGGMPSTGALIILGVIAAYALSVANTVMGGDVYFDTAAMLLVLVTVSRYLEARVRPTPAPESAAASPPPRRRACAHQKRARQVRSISCIPSSSCRATWCASDPVRRFPPTGPSCTARAALTRPC
jgi:hypothetical protein